MIGLPGMVGNNRAGDTTAGDISTGLALTPDDIAQLADRSVRDAFDTDKWGSPR